MSGHTPGYWRVDGRSISVTDDTAVADSCTSIALIYGSDAEAVANRHLIAAAPDFFAAVTGPEYPDIQSRLDWLSAYLHDTADAVCPAKTEDPDAWQTARDHCEALLRDLRAALSKAEGVA